MSSVFTKRDREASRRTHGLFWQANFVDKPNLIFWALTRPAALLIYNILIPFAVAYGLQAIITGHFDQVGHYAWVVLLLGLGYCVLWTVGGLTISKNGIAGTEFLQRTVFANYLQKDYDFYHNTFLGAIGAQAARLKDSFNEYCGLIMNDVVKQIIIVVSSVVIIAYQSPLLAGVTLVSMVLVLSFTIGSSKWRLKYRRILGEANSEAAGILGDALSHGATVKSFAAEDYEQTRFAHSLKKQLKAQYDSWVASIPADVGRMLLATIATVVLLMLTARMYQQHAISIAIVVLIQLYVIKLVNSTQEIANMIKAYESIMSSSHQAVKTMLVEPTILDKPQPKHLPRHQQFDILLSKVSFHYKDAPASITAIRDFNLEIKQGERVGLVGFSGSGKTTLTKWLLRFMDVTEGLITISGVDIRDLSQKELRSKVAYVPQEPLLFHRSIAENIAYGKPSATKKTLYEAAKNAYVDEFVTDLSADYNTMVGERGVKLSGGQRQRVAIARALLKDAPILVLDEATSALDSRSEQYIQKALWRLMKGRTALVIAHRLSTIQRMDKIVVMDKGRIVETGSHGELLAAGGVYAQLWAHQSGGYLVNPSTEETAS